MTESNAILLWLIIKHLMAALEAKQKKNGKKKETKNFTTKLQHEMGHFGHGIFSSHYKS